MTEIIKDKLYLGNKEALNYIDNSDNKWAFVHFGKQLFNENKPNSYKNEVYYTTLDHFYINWEDLPDNDQFDIKVITEILNFIDKSKLVYVHCDYGQSRSPAIVMTYLAKRTVLISPTVNEAIDSFHIIYPEFFDQGGICQFIKKNWDKIY